MTEPLRWSETFSIGRPELDAEHLRMIDLINRICVACGASQDRSNLLALLRELEGLTEQHFQHEEALLEANDTSTQNDRRILDGILEAKIKHPIEHGRRLNELRKMTRRLRTDARTAESKLCEELKAWFVDHAIGYEMQMRTIFQSV